MPDIAWTDVLGVASELTTTPVPVQDALLAMVNAELSSKFFGGDDSARFKLARIYLAAHMASAPGLAGVNYAGPINSEEEGGAKRSYEAIGPAARSHGSTMYGQMFDELVANSPMRFGAFGR
jgi:hypothetical protein